MTPITISRVWTQGAAVEVENLRGTAFTEENGAHRFVISGQDQDGNPVPLTGGVMAKFLRADNQTLDVDGEITEDGEASLTLHRDCYLVPGRFSLVIYLTDSGAGVSAAIYACVGSVYRATSGQELDSGTTVPSLQELTDAYQGALGVLNHSVRYDQAQSLTAAQKTRALNNIGAAPANVADDAVKVTAQTLQDEQNLAGGTGRGAGRAVRRSRAGGKRSFQRLRRVRDGDGARRTL